MVRRVTSQCGGPVLWRPGTAAALASVLLAWGLTGCAQPRLDQPQVDHATLDDDTFLGVLADRPLVTVDEAYRAMVILAEGEDPNEGFEQRSAWLQERDIARGAWKLQPNDYVDNGSVAFMVCRILQVKGGLNRIIFGSWGLGDRRYAYRELVYLGLIPKATTDYAPVTGGELVNLMGVADERMAEKGIYESEPVELELPAG